jgi:putative toxin-antitoxin system antitoxin component (TIGR02293 family)
LSRYVANGDEGSKGDFAGWSDSPLRLPHLRYPRFFPSADQTFAIMFGQRASRQECAKPQDRCERLPVVTVPALGRPAACFPSSTASHLRRPLDLPTPGELAANGYYPIWGRFRIRIKVRVGSCAPVLPKCIAPYRKSLVLLTHELLNVLYCSQFCGGPKTTMRHFAMLMCGIMSLEGIYAMATTNPTFEQYIGVSPKSALDMAEIAEKGLPTDSIAYLKEKGLTFSEVSEIVISPRTLKHRKARGEQLSVEETDRMLRVARIIFLADQVFANHEKALTWLRQVDERINDRIPLSMLHTESGGRLVENLLWQIDEGVYS